MELKQDPISGYRYIEAGGKGTLTYAINSGTFTDKLSAFQDEVKNEIGPKLTSDENAEIVFYITQEVVNLQTLRENTDAEWLIKKKRDSLKKYIDTKKISKDKELLGSTLRLKELESLLFKESFLSFISPASPHGRRT